MSVYAQEYGYFFNSQNSDRKYNADSFETWLKPFFIPEFSPGRSRSRRRTRRT